MSARVRPWGLLAEFASADRLEAAADAVRAAGYSATDAFTPFPVAGLAERLGRRRDRVALAVLLGAVAGGLAGYAIQYYSAVIDYPVLVGGKPLHAWPAFVPVAFELAVLGGALAGFFAMLVANGLPRLHHPVFGAAGFDLATRGRFFLLVESRDPRFDAAATRALLEGLGPVHVHEVPPCAE